MSTAKEPASVQRKEFSIYKPTQRGTGGVLRWGLALGKEAVFLDAANQNGERSFDWQGKITMKWGLSDIGETLAVLEGRQNAAKLFHQTEKQSTTFHLEGQERSEHRNYLARVTRQTLPAKKLSRVVVPISQGEAAVLATLLRAAAVHLARWD